MVCQEIRLEGHFVDSLTLSRVLDEVLSCGGDFEILDMHVGQRRKDPSQARIKVCANSPDVLTQLIGRIAQHGAAVSTPANAQFAPAPQDGVFPEGFYSTTNQDTLVRYRDQWHPVADQEMDCAICFDADGPIFRCVPLSDVLAGQLYVVGHDGIQVVPLERQPDTNLFEFMSSQVSTEKPKGVLIRQIAAQMHQARTSGGGNLLVGGPAIVHTGSVRHVVWLIENGYVDLLFAGNALAVHDIEQAMFDTSLGVSMSKATPVEAGHEHHLRAINAVRRHGSIRQAIEVGAIRSGIMHACIKNNVDFVLAGSIRDDGPLPEVITDTMEAQRRMRDKVRSVRFALMTATTLHSVATGNLLPARVKIACVDINPATVTKLTDRGSFQTVGLVTDVEPFLRELIAELKWAASASGTTVETQSDTF